MTALPILLSSSTRANLRQLEATLKGLSCGNGHSQNTQSPGYSFRPLQPNSNELRLLV